MLHSAEQSIDVNTNTDTIPSTSNDSLTESFDSTLDSIPTATSNNLLEYINNHLQYPTLQYFCNDIQDQLFDFSTIKPSDIDELKQTLSIYSNDEKINTLLIKFFNPELNTFELKDALTKLDHESFSSLSYKSAFNLLASVYSHFADQTRSNDTIRKYILYLLTSPLNLYIEIDSNYSKVGMNYNAFSHYLSYSINQYVENALLNSALTDLSKTYRDETILCAKPFTLPLLSPLAFICQLDQSNETRLAKLEYLNIEFVIPQSTSTYSSPSKYSILQSLEELFDQIIINYNTLTKPTNQQIKQNLTPFEAKSQILKEIKCRGFNFDGSLSKSVQLLSILAPSWDTMSASSALRNKAIPKALQSNGFGLSGGVRYTDSDIVAIFGGNYNLIDSSYGAGGDVVVDLVTNFNNFNQQSTQRKRQISAFLVNNRKRFNTILENATKVILNNLKTSLNPSSIRNELRNSQLLPNYLNSSAAQRNEFTNDAETMSNSLFKLYNSKDIKSFSEAIDFIVHDYIPITKQFANKCRAKYSNINFQSISNAFRMNRTLNIFGAAMSLDDVPVQPVQPTPAPAKTVTFPQDIAKSTKSSLSGLSGGKSTKPSYNYNDTPSQPEQSIVSGGSSGKDLVDSFIAGQKKFNRDYEIIYRQITAELNKVELNNIQQETYSKLYTICGQFEGIMIKNPMTTIYLSGYYGAKDYNNMYTKAVDSVTAYLRSTGISSFSGVISALESMHNLLVNTRKEMIELRNKYISSPKHVSELLIVSASAIKQPCKLTQTDFIALSDAVARLHEIIKRYTSKSTIAETSAQLKDYINKLTDREKIIKTHYEDEITAERTIFNQLPPSQNRREAAVARDIKISLIEQKRDALLYLNNVVDKYLAEDKIKRIGSNITQEQIKTIENAYIAFNNMRITPEFNKQMHKLAKFLEPVNLHIGNIWKFIRKLKKLIYQSQYIKFIEQLYKELKIFDNDFDWATFTNQICNLITISSVRVLQRNVYNVNGRDEIASKERLAYNLAFAFEKYLQTLNYDNNFPYVLNSGFLFMRDILMSKFLTGEHKSLQELKATFGARYPRDANFNALIADFENTDEVFGNIPLTDARGTPLIKGITFAAHGPPGIISGYEANKIPVRTAISNVIRALGATRRSTHDAIYYLGTFIQTIGTEYFGDTFRPKNEIPYHAENIAIFIYRLGWLISQAPRNAFAQEFNNLLASNHRETLDEYEFFPNMFEEGSKYENSLIQSTFEALFVNVFATIDNYWDIRYKGSLDLPLNISTVLRGGDASALSSDAKLYGASVFDSKILHDHTFSTIIPEAVPFYICATHISSYYINAYSKFDDRRDKRTELQLYLEVPKISALYPVYDIFRKQKATVASLTPTQLSTLLEVFNGIWNRTSGDSSMKLSKAIDIIFAEFNGCLIFTTEVQKELMKATKSFNSSTFDVIGVEINKIVESMKTVMNESILDKFASPEEQSKYFEQQLASAFRRVKAEPEGKRMSTLKAILSDNNGVNDRFNDYFKFMELVITPMLTTATCYNNIFALYNTYTLTVDTPNGNKTIDLEKILVTYNDVYDNKQSNTYSQLPLDNNHLCANRYACSLWELIQKIRGDKPYLKSALFDHPAVIYYNRLLLMQALDDLHKNNKFTLPNFWIVMDEHTYPQSPKLNIKVSYAGNQFSKSDYLLLLKQIYPTVHANTLADYYNQTLTEFYSDFDHYIHNFVSYPGLSDKTIQTISNTMHELVKLEGFHDENGLKGVLQLKGFNDEEAKRAMKTYETIKITKSSVYIYPPAPTETIIPNAVWKDTTLRDIRISPNSVGGCQIDGTSMYITMPNTPTKNSCAYHWTDWVLFNLARCDRVNFRIPYKLYAMFKDNGELARLVQSMVQRKDNTALMHDYAGNFMNIATSNIMARSEFPENAQLTDYSMLTGSWVAGLVSITPYLINTLNAARDLMQPSIEYDNINVNRELSILIEILTLFFDDIQSFTPFMGFMTDSIQLTTSKTKPHSFAELLSFVETHNVNNMTINDYIKMEWANSVFFNGLDSLVFPAFANRSPFEWIKEYAADKINNGVFSNEFDNTTLTLGRNVWAALIAKSASSEVEFKNTGRELDNLLLKCINIMSECDTGIIQQFCDNVVRMYRNAHNDAPVNYNNRTLTGGAKTIVTYGNEVALGNIGDLLTNIGTDESKSNDTQAALATTKSSTDDNNFSVVPLWDEIIKDPKMQIYKELFEDACDIAYDYEKTLDPDIVLSTINTYVRQLETLPHSINFSNIDVVKKVKNDISKLNLEECLQSSLKILSDIHPGFDIKEVETSIKAKTSRTIDQITRMPPASLSRFNDGRLMQLYNFNTVRDVRRGIDISDWYNGNYKDKKEIPGGIPFYELVKEDPRLDVLFNRYIPLLLNILTDYVKYARKIISIYLDNFREVGLDKPFADFLVFSFGKLCFDDDNNLIDEDELETDLYHYYLGDYTEQLAAKFERFYIGELNALTMAQFLDCDRDLSDVIYFLLRNIQATICFLASPVVNGFNKHLDIASYLMPYLNGEQIFPRFVSNVPTTPPYDQIVVNINTIPANDKNIMYSVITNRCLLYVASKSFLAIQGMYDRDALDIGKMILLINFMPNLNNFAGANPFAAEGVIGNLLTRYKIKIISVIGQFMLQSDADVVENVATPMLSLKELICNIHIDLSGNVTKLSAERDFVDSFFRTFGQRKNINNTMKFICNAWRNADDLVFIDDVDAWRNVYIKDILHFNPPNQTDIKMLLCMREFRNIISNEFTKLSGGEAYVISDIINTDDILNVAKIIAINVNSRQLYQDLSINLNTITPAFTSITNLAPFEFYNYKYIYNPNLAATFNRTRLPHSAFVNLTLGNNFIMPPKFSNMFDNKVDIRKYNKQIDLVNCVAYEGDRARLNINIMNVNGYSTKINNVKDKQGRVMGRSIACSIGNNDKIVGVKINNQTYQTLQIANVGAIADIDDTFTTKRLVVPGNNIIITRKVVPKLIKFDERMFGNMYVTNSVRQQIYSPQHNIYEATFNISFTESPLTDIVITDIDSFRQGNNPLGRLYPHVIDCAIVNDFNINGIVYTANSAINTKELVDFGGIVTNPIHVFIDKLLNMKLDSLVKSSNYATEYGFDIGSGRGLNGRGLFGGKVNLNSGLNGVSGGDINVRLSFNNAFVNPVADCNEFNEQRMLSYAYLAGSNENVTALSDLQPYQNGQRIYENVFGKLNGITAPGADKTKLMFNYIINYFHKYNISYNAIYDRVCFPSIIFGSTVLHAYMPKLIEKVKTIGIDTNGADKNATFKFICKYIEMFIHYNHEGYSLAMDYAREAQWQVCFQNPAGDQKISLRDKDMPFNLVLKLINNEVRNYPKPTKHGALWLANEYSRPSICNNFFSEIANYTTYTGKAYRQFKDTTLIAKDYTSEKYEKCENLYMLFGSSFMNNIRHIDCCSTLMYTLFMLLKHTSYYDIEENRDVSFFKTDSPEPLSQI